jgi:hypothetical protein
MNREWDETLRRNALVLKFVKIAKEMKIFEGCVKQIFVFETCQKLIELQSD